MDLSKIVNDKDRDFMHEACELYENGFYRASYIISFIVGMESLKERIRENKSFSNQLKDGYNKILSLEKQHQATESTIIEVAKNNNLITDEGESRLKYFREQRNVYSHPYSKKPTAIDCQHIIQSIIDIILSQTNLEYNDEILGNIIRYMTNNEEYLPNDKTKVNNFIVNDLLKHLNSEKKVFLFNELTDFYEKLTLVQKSNSLYYRTEWAMQSMLENISIKILFKNDTNIAQLIMDKPKTSIFLFKNTKVFYSLSDINKERFFDLLVNEGKYEELSILYYNEGENTLLGEDLLKKLKSILNNNTTYNVLYYFPAELIIDNLISMLASHNCYLQNEAIYLYRNKGFLKSIGRCKKDKIIILGRNILQSAGVDGYYKSDDALELLKYIAEDENTCFEIKEGIILECITSDNHKKIRPKLNRWDIVSNIYKSLNSKNKKKIDTQIEELIKQYEYDEWANKEEWEKIKDVLPIIYNEIQSKIPIEEKA